MKIFNTMTRKKEELTPLVPGEYRIYVCGPTVYNYVHIGNARPVVVFDTLRRYLEYQGNRVLFVSNITDIDDKIIAKAMWPKTATCISALRNSRNTASFPIWCWRTLKAATARFAARWTAI